MSPPPFDTLDFATARGNAGSLRENQLRLARAVGFAPDALHQTVQVHGKVVVVANGVPSGMASVEADAIVAEPGTDHAVAVRVADCVPVLLADPWSGRVAAVHAGWRGVEAGIAFETIRHMTSATGAADPKNLLAAIGPSIGSCCFEVSAEVGERIAKASTENAIGRRYVGTDGSAKMLVDLRAAVRAQLEMVGLDHDAIDDVPSRDREGCTKCNAQSFYSFRRDGDASGRLVGVIVASKGR